MSGLSAESVYEAAFNIWNQIMELAVTMFTTSPSNASGNVYSTIKTLYDAIKSISIPIATVFFLIAIIKETINSDSNQAARKLSYQTIKYTVFLGILNNTWEIMGMIMSVADGITVALGSASSITMEASDDLNALVAEINALEPTTQLNASFLLDTATWFEEHIAYMEEQIEILGIKAVFFVSAVVFLGTIIACCLSILSAAFQRILKPLVIMPFSAITVALSSGTAEAERVSVSYVKTFFGFCLSGAFMVVCVNIGTAMANGGLIVFDMSNLDTTGKMIYICLQNIVTPIVIAGLVKSVDSIIGRFF